MKMPTLKEIIRAGEREQTRTDNEVINGLEYEFIPFHSPRYERIFGTTENRDGTINWPEPPSSLKRVTRNGMEGVLFPVPKKS
ncbi:hypothetical protein pSALSNUABM04_073 [Salmonella phage pSal-SNUABM-04]|nr:hypothetical protein pSALSNUABM04_073 [Salmonella phage pSal-SNUABM-04]